METHHDIPRYEVVLLEDDPHTRELLEGKLSERGMTVHAYASGEEALEKIQADPNVGALLTDIEILDAYPDGDIAGLQGYDVANRIREEAPHRLLSIVVMTRLPGDAAFDNLNAFNVPFTTVHKTKWIGAEKEAERDKAFDELASRLKEAIRKTPHNFYEELEREHPKNRWITRDYWSVYRSLWFSKNWPGTETRIAERATEIVQDYLEGESRKLKGEILSFSEQPSEGQLLDHLIGRRVIYALNALHPAYWETLICGERIEEEKTALDPEVWQHIESDEVRSLFNKLQRRIARNDLARQHEEYERLSREERQSYREAKEAAQADVKNLGRALDGEPDDVQRGFIPYLRFWNLNFTEVDWTTNSDTAARDQQNLKQTLLLLGIRKDDIKDEHPENWKLLLPEERLWLKRIVEQFGKTSAFA